MHITYTGTCPCCSSALLQHESIDMKFEACLRCGFAFGSGVGEGSDAGPEPFERIWFWVWSLLFKTYQATTRRELSAKLRAAGMRFAAPVQPPHRKTLFDYQIGHLALILATMGCSRSHRTPCPNCASFERSPLAAQILEDISKGDCVTDPR